MTMPTYAQTFQAGAQAPWGIGPTIAGEFPQSGPGGEGARFLEPGAQPQVPLDDPCIVSFESLLASLQGRPAWQCAVEGHPGGLDWDRLLDHGPAPLEPEAQARWEGARDALARFKPFLKEREARLSGYIRQRDYQRAVALLKSHDHLYDRTMHLMEHYLERLPGVLRRLVLPHLGSEFGAFAELYRYLRHGAELAERHMHARAKAGAASPPRDGSRAGEVSASGARRSAHAVEGPLRPAERAAAQGETPASREEERAALVRRVKSGGAREGDLLRYLELSGVGE